MNKLPLFLLLIFLFFSKINKTFAADNVPGSSQTAKVTIADNSDTLTINSGITLGNLTTQQRADINEKNDVSVIVNSGGSILSLHNAVQGDDSDDLTVTNSGTIRAAGSKAINLKDTARSSITNNSGGIIRSGLGAPKTPKPQRLEILYLEAYNLFNCTQVSVLENKTITQRSHVFPNRYLYNNKERKNTHI